MGGDSLAGKVPHGLPPPGGLEDCGHGPQASFKRYMGISINWGGAGNVGNRINWGVYCLPLEHGCTKNWDLYYHGIVSGGEAEARYAAIVDMVGTANSRYNRYKSGEYGSGYDGRDRNRVARGKNRLGHRRAE